MRAVVDSLMPRRVIRTFQFPGVSAVRLEVIQLLFDMCSFRVVERKGSSVHVPILNEEGRKVASPVILLKVRMRRFSSTPFTASSYSPLS